jgi:hypothetical protein
MGRPQHRVGEASGFFPPVPLAPCFGTIKTQRSDLRLHDGFGIKFHALQSPTVRELLYSSDSMAWSFAGRRSGSEHDPRIALAYAAKIEALVGQPIILPQHSSLMPAHFAVGFEFNGLP